jgi:hypothetical protein
MKVRSWSSNLGLPAAVVWVVIASKVAASVNDLPAEFQSRIRRRNLRNFLRIFVYFSLDLMRKLLVLATALLASCAEEPPVSTTPKAPVQPHFIGSVKSISSADMRAIADLERDAIVKEFHSAPTSMTIRVINHNHVMVFFEVRGQQCGDPVDRVGGKWRRPGGPRATIVRSNHALEPTAGRCDEQV